MNTFISDQAYEDFLKQFKLFHDVEASETEASLKKFLVTNMGLNESQGSFVLPYIVDSFQDIPSTIFVKTFLTGKYAYGSSKGVTGFGYSSGSATQYTFRQDFSFESERYSRSSYFSSPSAYSSLSYVSEPTHSKKFGIYFLGKCNKEILEANVMVCLNDGTCNQFRIIINGRRSSINGMQAEKSW